MSKLTSYKKLVRDYPILTKQMTKKRLEIILRELSLVLEAEVPGDIAEFGCYSGTTSLFISRLLVRNEEPRTLHVYDSFSGLPPKSIEDASVAGSDFKAGELKASKRDLIKNYKKANLKLPIIHKGWFSELKDKEIPETIAFAFLDGDFYASIIDSLTHVWPRLSEKGVIVIDDFGKSNLPGVSRAVGDFFKDKEVKLQHEHDLAIIKKL